MSPSKHHPGEETTPLLHDSHSSTQRPTSVVASPRNNTTDDEDSDYNGKHQHVPPSINWPVEIRLILSYSIPLIGTYLLQYSYTLITVLVVGHIGQKELAAVSIGLTTMNVVGYSIFEGMATSLDTLCTQAWGAGNRKLVGVHVQRMIILMMLVALPIAVVWVFSPTIIAVFVKQPELAEMAGSFLRMSLIGLPGYAVFEAAKRFIQAQGDFVGSLIVLIICAPVNVALNWLFAFHLNMGHRGAALAAALTNGLRPILLVIYIVFFAPQTHRCWPGLFPRSLIFRNWGPMVRLSAIGATMTLCEWFAFEIVTFSTSHISTAALATQSILATISVVVWHIPFSASVAVSTRVGHLVGAGAVQLAKRLSVFYTACFLAIGLGDMLFLLLLRHRIPKLFTTDPEVLILAAQTLPFVAAFQVMDSLICCAHGLLRGLARQAIGGWTTFVVNYAYAVPLAIYLELGPPKLGLRGCWTALASGMVVMGVVEAGIMVCMDWNNCVADAKEREEVDDVAVGVVD